MGRRRGADPRARPQGPLLELAAGQSLRQRADRRSLSAGARAADRLRRRRRARPGGRRPRRRRLRPEMAERPDVARGQDRRPARRGRDDARPPARLHRRHRRELPQRARGPRLSRRLARRRARAGRFRPMRCSSGWRRVSTRRSACGRAALASPPFARYGSPTRRGSAGRSASPIRAARAKARSRVSTRAGGCCCARRRASRRSKRPISI